MFNKIHIKTTGLLVLFIYAVINIASPFIEVRKAYADAPVCVYPPGAYDPSSGYCVTNPLDEKHSCPQYYTFNYETNKCVLMPVCSGMYIYNKNTKQCDPIEATAGDGESSWTMPANACAVDSNGDGEVQQNEIFACTQTPQGYICPQGQTECIEQFSQPNCPAGYTYNGQTQKCEADTTIGACSSQNVPYTNYQCPRTGQIYADATTCNNNCFQTASCNADTTMYSSCSSDFWTWGEGGYTGCIDIQAGQIRIRTSYETRTWVPLNGSGLSAAWGRSGGHPRDEIGIQVQNGYIAAWTHYYNKSGGVYNYYYTGDFIPLQSGNLYQSNVQTSYSIFLIQTQNNNIRIGACDYWDSEDCGFGAWIPVVSISYYCPLPGGSSCSGNPPTCSVGQSCTTHTSYANKYQCSLNGTFYDTQAQCTTSCYSGCPAGGSFNSQTGKCEAPATCPSGTLQANGCFTGYGCPLGNYQCMNVNSKWMCSPNQCFTESQIENDDPDMIASTYDSAASNEDMCTGEWSIFSGSKMRCQKSGIKTGFHNCCDESQGKIYDSVGSTGISAITDAVGAIYAATEAVKIGSYALDIAAGNYLLEGGNLAIGNGLSRVVFSEGSKEFAALSKAAELKQAGASADEVVGTAMGTYIEKMGPQIAAAIAQLAISQVISDPVIASAVNLAFSASLWIAGSAGGPVGFALSAATLAANLFMASCDKQDVITSTMADSGMCHYVGTYCTKKIKFVGCVQKVKSYCCFNSKLARIVHEQGRPQLASFGPDGGWGSEKHPNCRGFKPEEFQALNFDNIDLSEYTQDIERNMRKNIESSLQNTATQSLQNRGVK
ncbi:conjugal transfer protein TraN [Thermodesulfovibrio thiophilus]|uniref:conjugal transfer protein TraN n=1 Tax=Thermodesulfovibrio thiophilus TaxID=340095 RepID=UPI000405D08E|nr:conjugal transfer protein TraN [Thermodesulfovibrio thiophilus]